MTESRDELAVIQTLVERFEKQRLPRLLELKNRVENGEALSDMDIQFMVQVTLDAQQNRSLIERHPEWRNFCAEVIHLYEEITEMALKNETKS
ncbi:MAG: hypothetical protein PVI91_03345 [Gammaproteobacteria bacterium]|jgi:hypothetical protein